MKTFKNLLLIAGILTCASLAAVAQSGFDIYGGTRTVIVDGPRIMSGNAVNIVTNNSVQINSLVGIVKLDIFSQTNANAGAMTATLQTSPDLTNWTALANYSLATTTSIIATNNMYAAQLKSTNVYNLPGAIVTPTAATAGFATPYLDSSANPFTNNGPITVTAAGVYTIGFNVEDAGRYLRIYWTPSGSATNWSGAALLTGKAVHMP